MKPTELLNRYNAAFKDIMDEARPLRLRITAAIRAMTYAEIMGDNERLLMAATAADDLFGKLLK